MEVLICGYFFNVVGNFFVSWLSSNNSLFLLSSSGDSFIKKGGHIAFLFQEVQFSEIDFCCFVSDSYDEVYEMEASQRRLSTKMSNHSIIMEKKKSKIRLHLFQLPQSRSKSTSTTLWLIDLYFGLKAFPNTLFPKLIFEEKRLLTEKR